MDRCSVPCPPRTPNRLRSRDILPFSPWLVREIPCRTILIRVVGCATHQQHRWALKAQASKQKREGTSSCKTSTSYLPCWWVSCSRNGSRPASDRPTIQSNITFPAPPSCARHLSIHLSDHEIQDKPLHAPNGDWCDAIALG